MVTNLYPSTLGNYFERTKEYLDSKGINAAVVLPTSPYLSAYQLAMKGERTVAHSNANLPLVVAANNDPTMKKIVLVEPGSYVAEPLRERLMVRGINRLPKRLLKYIGGKDWALKIFMDDLFSAETGKDDPARKSVLEASKGLGGVWLVRASTDEENYEKGTGLLAKNMEGLKEREVHVVYGSESSFRKYIETGLPSIDQYRHVIPRSGHLPMLENPEEFNHVLAEILE